MQVLGNGAIKDIHDLVFVDIQQFDRAKGQGCRTEVSSSTRSLSPEASLCPDRCRPLGKPRPVARDPGHMGSDLRRLRHRRIGVQGYQRDPSQGSHFFQKSHRSAWGTSLSIRSASRVHRLGMAGQQPAAEEFSFTRHLQFRRADGGENQRAEEQRYHREAEQGRKMPIIELEMSILIRIHRRSRSQLHVT